MKRLLVFVLMFFCFGEAFGKIYIDVTSPASTKIGVALDLSGVPLKDFDVVLKRDLMVYGIFAVYPVSKLVLTEEELRIAGADLLLSVDKSAFRQQVKVSLVIKDLTDGTVVVQKLLTFDRSAQIKAAHMVADELYRVVTGNKGMFYRNAVAVRKVLGRYQLVYVDVGAMSFKVLKVFKQPVQSPAMSPDGKKIAFALMSGEGNFDIYIYDLPTGGIKKACSTPGPDTAPSWMPDGRALVFSGYVAKDNADILLCDLSNGRLKRLTRSMAIDTSPSVSPDGTKIAFVSNRDGYPRVYVKDLKTGLIYGITKGTYDVSPDWSPKGGEIAYATLVGGTFRIGIYNLATGDVYYPAPGEDPSWSPNGDYIIYTKSGGLFISSLYANSKPTRLFVGKWLNPEWR